VTDRAAGMIDHFKLIRLLGRGGMGEVHLARDTLLGRRVALKLISSARVGRADAVARFLDEARATASFSHPNIITVYQVGEHLGQPYLALEYIDGCTLRERTVSEQLGLRELIRVMGAVAGAVQEAHQRGILHRDLKPENVMIARDGRILVVDLGLAKNVAQSSPDGSAPPGTAGAEIITRPCGTPAYMAPELRCGSPATTASDVWALGVMLQELASGRAPVSRHVSPQGGFPAVAAGAEDEHLLAELDRLIAAALEREPSARPSAATLASALTDLLREGQVGAARGVDCPFRGLLPFSERQAHAFFGRDTEVSAFVERLREEPILPVVGVSGAGKTSFVQAGVIPRLKEHGRWLIIRVRPGPAPLVELVTSVMNATGTSSISTRSNDTAEADSTEEQSAPRSSPESVLPGLENAPTRLSLWLNEVAESQQVRVLLFVDQLEEIYTLCDDVQTRNVFMDAICTAADDPAGPVRVVFTLRDDFLSRIAETRAARRVLGRVVVMRSPSAEALEETLALPLRATGYRFEDEGLIEAMVDEVKSEPAALPSLQFAAQMLWERRDTKTRTLTRAAFESIGGVAGALAHHADGVLSGLTAAQEKVAREILLKLVSPAGTRRMVSRRALLAGLPQDAAEVLEGLVLTRTLVVRRGRSEDDAEVELAHESLLTSWERLRRWLEESRESRAHAAEIEQAAELWERRGKRAAETWSGEALADGSRRARSTTLSSTAIAFLEAGRRREARARKLKAAMAGSSVVIATGIAVVLAFAWQSAERQRVVAEQEQIDALLEGARADILGRNHLNARAKIRSALELGDSRLARPLWWSLQQQPLRWSFPLPAQAYAVAALESPGTPPKLAAGGADGTIHLIDLHGQRIDSLRGTDAPVFALASSPDGRRIAAGMSFGMVDLWDMASRKLRVLDGHPGGTRAVAFTPDGATLVTGGRDGKIRLWGVESGKEIRVVGTHDGEVRDVALDPSGKRLATGGTDGVLQIWDLDSGKRLAQSRGLGRIHRVLMSPDGTTAFVAGFDKTVKKVEVPSGKVIGSVEAGVLVKRMLWRDGRLLAAGPDDTNRLVVFDVFAGRTIGTLAGHESLVEDALFLSGASMVATASDDKSVRLFGLEPERMTTREHHLGPTYAAAFLPDGTEIVSGGQDGRLVLWDVATGTPKRALAGHTDKVSSLDVSSTSPPLIASGGDDRTVRLWSPGKGTRKLLATLADVVRSVQLSNDARMVAASTVSPVRVWDTDSGAEREPFAAPGAAPGTLLWDLAFGAGDQLLAAAGDDGKVYLWDVQTRRAWKPLEGHTAAVIGVAFRADGQELASTSADSTLRLWDLKTRTARVIKAEGPWVHYGGFSGNRYGAALSDGTARIWDTQAGGLLLTLQGHRDGAVSFAFSPDGKLGVTTSADSTIRVWDTQTGRPRWSAPMMVTDPPLLASNGGFRRLDTAEPARPEQSEAFARIVVDARSVSLSRDGKTACSLSHAGDVAHWKVGSAKPEWTASSKRTARIEALDDGCLTLADGKLDRWRSEKERASLSASARGFAASDEGTLVVEDSVIRSLDGAGTERARYEAGQGATAAGWVSGRMVIGYRDGGLVAMTAGSNKTVLQDTPSGQVERIVAGPTETVVAGYSGGFVGIWDLQGGSRLHLVSLHGAVEHLVFANGRLRAATELGDSAWLDLRTFDAGHCDLLREVSSSVPKLWTGSGVAAAESKPAGGRCL